jgi:hypothetical protein
VKHSGSGLGRVTRLGVLLSATALLASPALAGCSAMNPVATATTYAASDGVNGSIEDPAAGVAVQLRNFLVVGTKKGSPGALIGAVVNQGTKDVEVKFTVLDAAGQSPVGTGSITVKPGELMQIGPAGTPVSLASMPTDAGTVIKLKADTAAGGQMLDLPVLAAEGAYASLAPSA